MPLFRYRAIDLSGEPMEGTMEEESAHRVTLILQERGAQVNYVEEVAPKEWLKARPRRLRWEDISLLNDQLLSIARGGIPIAPAVRAMAKDLDNRSLRPVLEQMHSDLDAGRTLEEAIERSPKRFPPIYASLIRAGERSGDLTGVLQMLSSYSTRVLDLRNRIFMAMTYPVLVVFVGVLCLINMLVFVVPQFAEIFEDFGAGLPAPTQLLVDMSALLHTRFADVITVVVAAAAVLGVAYWRLKSNDKGRARIDRFRQAVPLFGKTFRSISLSRFSKALGLLLKAEVPILESLDLASAASGNDYLRSHVTRAMEQIAQGEKIADAFSDTLYFPHSYLWFLANGEDRGEVPETLLELSDTYEREVSTRDEAMVHLLAPAAIVMLGAVFAYMMIALYLPIFSLGDAISG